MPSDVNANNQMDDRFHKLEANPYRRTLSIETPYTLVPTYREHL